MKSKKSSGSAIACTVVFGLWVGLAAAQERTSVWLTLDESAIGPVVSCDGEFRVSGGGTIRLSPWCQDGKDAVEGTAFTITTGHDAQTAEAAKLPRVYRSALSRGLLLEIDADRQARLSATTKLGDFEVPLGRLQAEPFVSVLEGKIRLERIPNVARLTGDEAEEEYPSVAALPDGKTAVAYVAWDGRTDSVKLRLGDRIETLAEGGDYLEPRCAVDGQGNLWVVWAAAERGQWDLWARSQGRTTKLTDNRLNDFWPRLARDAHGNLWLAWQTVADNLHYELFVARLGPKGLAEPLNVSQSPADDWEPAICSTPDGRLVIAWDTYRNGSYDVYLREFAADADGGLKALGPPRPVAATARREAHATLAADSRNRVWIAWDTSVEDWGKHPAKGATLHSDRASDLACYADGQLKRVGVDFMESLPEPLDTFIEYPQVAVDGKDRVWMIFRFENRVVPFYRAGGRAAQSYGMWHLFASQFDGQAWSRPVLLAGSNGRQDVRVDVATDAAGELLITYGADGRARRLPYQPVDYDVLLASLAGMGKPMRDFDLREAPDLGPIAPVQSDPELDPLPRSLTAGGKKYRLVIGDTHRHTDISRCGNGRDGSLQDAYRYALNTTGLDWLAISDHDQDILKHRNDKKVRPRTGYDWWRSQKYCDLYTIPGRFVALYGYEHGGSYQARGGHKNIVVAQRGNPVVEVDAPDELFAALAGSGALAIPHQLADGGSRTDWEKWNQEYERVAEIFQARGSYEFEGCPRVASIYTEGHSMWDALARGIRIGIIASSDHGQTHQARAGVYIDDVPGTPEDVSTAPGFTREGILDALRARRAFGATVAVSMQVRIGDHLQGEEFTVGDTPTIEGVVHAPAEIARLDVVRDNRFIFTSQPKTTEARLKFTDFDLQPGQSSYYYVRALIGAEDVAWSSPLWVTREP
jgi:hypothetical protein